MESEVQAADSRVLFAQGALARTLIGKYALGKIELDIGDIFRTATRLKELNMDEATALVPRWVRCVSFELLFPFNGEPEYLTLIPDDGGHLLGKCLDAEQLILLKCSVPLDKLDNGYIQASVDALIEQYQACMGSLNNAFAQFNDHLPAVIAQTFENEIRLRAKIESVVDNMPYRTNADYSIAP